MESTWDARVVNADGAVVEPPPRPDRTVRPRTKVLMALVVVAAIVVTVSLLGHGPFAGRGNPDPGGHRLATIRALARRAVPSGASDVHTSVEESPDSTGQGGCQQQPGATRGTVPQRTDRRCAGSPAAGKGETAV